MSKISLRAYNKEVESLIDRGEIDEAIVNCRYILQTYPKCIATYRNLAKALLESKKYPEAEDIFDRVLSVYPDDFVSHIGISIIKENEGNLDAAIWHMELAYDVQPSNPALTSELRRLFGRRDGVQPSKIRLTRGALIRMYARGELFQQAIAEIQSALTADPKRIDLEVILADMYYYSGALAEASETCNDLLASLPYCFEANQLMMQIVPRTSQMGSAKMHRDRLAELDPYYAFITTPDTLSDEIPEDQVLLEHYSGEGSSYEENRGLPKTTDADWEKITESENLDWAEDGEGEKDAAIASITLDGSIDDILEASITRKLKANDNDGTESAAPSNTDNIPEWMRSAGWIPATHSEQELLDNSDISPENISNETNEIQPGELPEWLHNASPESAKQGYVNEEPQSDSEIYEPMEPIAPKVVYREPDLPLTENPSQDSAPTKTDRTPEPLSENTQPEQGETGEKMPTDSSTNNENEWLNQFRNDSPNKGEENDLPDWLKDFESEKDLSAEENMDIPEWLKSLEPLASSSETTPAVLGSSSYKDDAFPREDEGESAVAGKSFLFTKDLTNEEIQAGKYDTAYIDPDSQSEPSAWEAPTAKLSESESESAVASVTKAEPEEVESAIEGTDFMFTKALTEEEAKSGKLDSTYLPPEAHALPSDWESSLEKTQEPPQQPAREAHAVSALPAWVKNVLKPSAPAEAPAQVPPPSLPVTPVPESIPTPSEPSKSSILDQLDKAAAPVEASVPEGAAPVSAVAEPARTQEPETSESAQAQSSPTAEELGEEPIEDLVSGPQGSGAITDDTNNELLDWLRSFKGSEEQVKENQPSVEEPVSTPEQEEASAVDRLGEFAQPEPETAVTGVTGVSESEGIESVVESLEETVILQDETEVPLETPVPAESSIDNLRPEPADLEPVSEPVEEPATVDETEQVFEPVDESKISEFFVQQAEPLAEQPAQESPELELEHVVSEAEEPVVETPVTQESAPQIVVPVAQEMPVQLVEPEVSQVIPEPVEEMAAPEIVAPEPVVENTIPAPVAEVAQPLPEPQAAELPKTSPVVPDPLRVAEAALDKGDMPLALNEFNMALHDEANLPAVIVALKSAIDRHGNDNDLWQLLGDAFAHSNRFDEAFSAYDEAETLLLNLSK